MSKTFFFSEEEKKQFMIKCHTKLFKQWFLVTRSHTFNRHNTRMHGNDKKDQGMAVVWRAYIEIKYLFWNFNVSHFLYKREREN